jgi:hypothetical protein
MPRTLELMLKEEWRIHSVMFGNRDFSFFPLVMLVMAFVGSMLMPLYRMFLSSSDLALVLHLAYAFFGLSVGGFGLMGREAMNRRLGDISLIAFISRTLPISERRIFANFVIKDTLFYLVFLVAPFLTGYALARVLLGLSLAMLARLTMSLTLSFLVGLSTSFVLTTLYAHLGKAFLMILAAGAFTYTLMTPGWLAVSGLVYLLPPLQYYLFGNTAPLLQSLMLFVVPSVVSVIFVKMEYRTLAHRFPNQFFCLRSRLSFCEFAPFISKDVLDLNRSEGGLGKIVLNYVFPLGAIALLTAFLSGVLPIQSSHYLLVMALMAGVVSTSIYTWLAEYDFPELYAFLPIPTSYIIKSKLVLSGVLSASISSITLFAFYVWLRPPAVFLPLSGILAASVFAYVTSVTVYLTGLRPNLMLYSGRVFLTYLAYIMPPLICLAAALMTGAMGQTQSVLILLLYAAVLLPGSALILGRGISKWERT